MNRALPAIALLVALAAAANAMPAKAPANVELSQFRAWLDREHPGYGSDEGPARFKNPTVEAAYPVVRLYYVLTYTRGIPPPFAKSLSLVAAVDSSRVVPYEARRPESYRRGMKKVTSGREAKVAAAAVLILASCDPNERRWKLAPDRFKVKKDSKGWLCTYAYDSYHSSWVRFDKKGIFRETGGSAPPVP
jgi:hypothetical protein